MPSTLLQLEIDDATITAAKPIITEAGLTITSVLEGALKRIANDGCVHMDHFSPSSETLAAMEELCNGGGQSFPDVESLMADLNADE